MTPESHTAQSGPSAVEDKGPWRRSNDGRDVFSDDFTVDAALRISGDFTDDDHRRRYADWIAERLNQLPPAGARDAVTDAAVSLRGLADVIRRHGTCAPMALEVVAERLEALTGKACSQQGCSCG